MLEILKKIAGIALDVQHIQRTSNILYSNPNVSPDNVTKLCDDMGIALESILTEANNIKELMTSVAAIKKD